MQRSEGSEAGRRGTLERARARVFALVVTLAAVVLPAPVRAGDVVLIEDASGFIGPQVRALSVDGSRGGGSDLYANGFVWDGAFTAVPSLGGSSSFVFDVSQDAAVAVGGGSNGSVQQALRWTSGTGSVSLGTLSPGASGGAVAVSADGAVVVGNSHGMPFRWTSGTGMVALPGVTAIVSDVSANGERITGTSIAGAIEAFVWTETVGLTGLGAPPDYENTSGNAISADGTTVVGGAFDEDTGTEVPYRWTVLDGMVALGSWPQCAQHYANKVSGNGRLITGDCWLSDGITRIAFVWTESAGLQTLAGFLAQRGIALPRALSEPEITAVSTDGRVLAVVDLDQTAVWSLLIDVSPEIPALRGMGRGALAAGLLVVAAAARRRLASSRRVPTAQARVRRC